MKAEIMGEILSFRFPNDRIILISDGSGLV